MIDFIGLASLIRGLLKDWTENQVIIISPLNDIENEPAWQQLKQQKHELVWSNVDKVRKRKRDGWEPVVERDNIGRPSIFMDSNKELILMHKKP